MTNTPSWSPPRTEKEEEALRKLAGLLDYPETWMKLGMWAGACSGEIHAVLAELTRERERAEGLKRERDEARGRKDDLVLALDQALKERNEFSDDYESVRAERDDSEAERDKYAHRLLKVEFQRDALASRVARLEASLKSFRDNYDHDDDAHTYSTMCRCCEAERILNDAALKDGEA